MGFVENAKEVVALVQKLDNIELLQKIISLQNEALALLEENSTLRRERDEVSAKLSEIGDLEFRDSAYYDDDSGDGPFCSSCVDVKRQRVRLHNHGQGVFLCPAPDCGVRILTDAAQARRRNIIRQDRAEGVD